MGGGGYNTTYDVYIRITDDGLWVCVMDYRLRTEKFDVYPIDNQRLPIDVSAWINYFQRRYGKGEEGLA